MRCPIPAARRPTTPAPKRACSSGRNRATGAWQFRVSPGGVNTTWSGKFLSSDALSAIVPKGLESVDVLDSTSVPNQLSFAFKVAGGNWDGVKFHAPRPAPAPA